MLVLREFRKPAVKTRRVWVWINGSRLRIISIVKQSRIYRYAVLSRRSKLQIS